VGKALHPDTIASGTHCGLPQLLALRQLAGRLDLAKPRSTARSPGAAAPSRLRGRGLEFEEFRAYAAGDDVRAIDWRVSARTGRVHTRLFRTERERPVLLLCDQRATMFFGSRTAMKSVQCAHATALLGWAALAGGDRVGGMVLGPAGHHELRPRRSQRALLAFLQQVAAANGMLSAARGQSPGTGLGEALAGLRRVARPGALVFLLSDFHDWDADCAVQLRLLAEHVDVHGIRVHDAMEEALPAAGPARFGDGIRNLLADTRDPSLRETFARRAAERAAGLATAFTAARARLTPLRTGESAAAVLGRCYAERAAR
jgi:uncharacterized protein (DUF58 family)